MVRRVVFPTTAAVIAILTIVGFSVDQYRQRRRTDDLQEPAKAAATGAASPTISDAGWASPLGDPASRVNKKKFGTHVTPQNSPVQPERFTGYHTGWDFETTPDEAGKSIVVVAFCPGSIQLRQWASGYGGVAVEACQLQGRSVTVLYGHLNIDSIRPVGTTLKVGDPIGELGQANSQQTDGERKHLHFAIHRGSEINLKGYVEQSDELSGWLDPALYLSQS